MLTASVRQPEPVTVDPPSSTTETLMPRDAFLVSIDKTGRTFIEITSPVVKGMVFMEMAKKFSIPVTTEDSVKFLGAGPIGLSLKEIPGYLEMDPAERAKVAQKGIPYDTTNNSELQAWAEAARLADFSYKTEKAAADKVPLDLTKLLQFAIKADAGAKYNDVKRIIEVFRRAEVEQFQMITSLEDNPAIKK
jgi:biopolymer transport protein ExbD